jgi:PTH1 family peptidyl-tRNA hydrolase
MKLIIGLGNPGREYEGTRHNAGWMVLDAFAEKFNIKLDKHERNAMTGQRRVAGGQVLLAKPLTYMNLSGEAVKGLFNLYGESLDELMIVYDDIDLPVGRLRIRPNGSSGTHNGMRSIVSSLASEGFPRLRFGVRGENEEAVRNLRDYVLEGFEPNEMPAVTRGIERSVDALVLFARGDLRRAMNEFNRDPKDEEPATKTAETRPPADTNNR